MRRVLLIYALSEIEQKFHFALLADAFDASTRFFVKKNEINKG